MEGAAGYHQRQIGSEFSQPSHRYLLAVAEETTSGNIAIGAVRRRVDLNPIYPH